MNLVTTRIVSVRSSLFVAALAIAGLSAACAGRTNARPLLTGVAPARLSAGGRYLIIEGGNFARGAQAVLGGQPVTELTWVNSSVLTGFMPAGIAPGSYDLSVTNPDGATATLRGGITVLAANGASTNRSAAPSAGATSPTSLPARTPSAAATAAPATRTPAPAAASRTATRPPQRPVATATPDRSAFTEPAADLSGSWQITDDVSYGPGSGQSFSFSVTLRQQGTAFSGTGDGLSISGTVNGFSLHADYVQDNGSGGSFDWTLAPDGASFSGSFTNSSGNGGASSGQRLSATFAASPSNEKPPSAAPVGESSGRGGRKKKER